MVFGCASTVLGEAERRFFRQADPLGFILFSRNCGNPDQVRALIGDLLDCVGRAEASILIDQEGGRVARLKPPHWRAGPAAGRFAELARLDPERGEEAARLNARLIAAELSALGITVNCAPVLDLPRPGADAVIGDRAAGDTPELAARLGRAACEGFLGGGVLPVIKHIPGHGRAFVDTHNALAVVDAPLEELRQTDFAPFRALKNMPWAMTAHVVYSAVDPSAPATLSAKAIEETVRGNIGFDGLLISDDLSMGALSGDMGSRAAAALGAGLDVVLHCNGDMAEMEAVAAGSGPMDSLALERLARGEAMRLEAGEIDARRLAVRLDSLMEGAA